MKIRVPLMLLLMSIVLAGCSFSFGDGETLEISKDGVQTAASEKDMEKEVTEVKEDATEESATDETADSNAGEASLADKLTNKQNCEEDYEDLLEIMPENLAMPDCALVTSTSTRDYDHATEQYGEYTVEKSWKELYALYKEFLEGNAYAITDQSKSESGGKINGKKELKIFIVEFKEDNDGVTRVWLNERTEKPEE